MVPPQLRRQKAVLIPEARRTGRPRQAVHCAEKTVGEQGAFMGGRVALPEMPTKEHDNQRRPNAGICSNVYTLRIQLTIDPNQPVGVKNRA